ncbi:hypothetical protein BIZ83_gp081 [Erwinia phage vB_EamM_ChrisDB]|nr:hypothetical protein BIZ83_gp081 [Erwinia phage vB_EamM_ChrisDB]ANZ48772.1 hypothetical protein CHRISDB_210 [Erwinia phage vB_EamM_ChrisDB]
MTAESFDAIVTSVAFTGLCLWIVGKALGWVLKHAEKKGALDGQTNW